MEEEMTNEQMYTMLRMVLAILEGCANLDVAKERIKALIK